MQCMEILEMMPCKIVTQLHQLKYTTGGNAQVLYCLIFLDNLSSVRI